MIDPLLAVEFDWRLFEDRVFNGESVFWEALAATVYVAVIAQVLGVALGLVTALAGRSHVWPVRALAATYTLVIRGTPIIVQIFFVYFGANLFLGFDLFPRSVDVLGLGISGAIVAGIVALAINEGAYMSEIIRSGIDSVDKGQLESAQALGMTRRLAMRRIVLPQAARVIVPPLGNQFNSMIKTTSLLAFIGVYELFQDAQVGYSASFKPVEYFAGVALWYLLLTTLWSLIQIRIERRLGQADRPDSTGEPVPLWRSMAGHLREEAR
jgi:polar amino acid transport system permease protein